MSKVISKISNVVVQIAEKSVDSNPFSSSPFVWWEEISLENILNNKEYTEEHA